MKINIGDIVETIITNKRGVVSHVADKFIVIEFLDGSEGDYILNGIENHIKLISSENSNVITKVNFSHIRKAKVIINELTELLEIINSSIYALQQYKKYVTINEAITSLKESKMILEIHLKKNKNILKNAGIKEDE